MYPQLDGVCLLCNQPLSLEAHDHLHRIWKILQNDTQRNISMLESKLQVHLQNISLTSFDFFGENSVSCRLLSTEYPSDFETINKFLDTCKSRRSQLGAAINNKTIIDILPLPLNGISDLWRLIGALESQQHSLKLKRDGVEEEIGKLTSGLRFLEHRKILSTVLDDVVAYIDGEKWIEIASTSKARGSTTHITKKYNTLFSELVTEKYVSLFSATLANLNCPLDVEIRYKAEKGKTFKQLVLVTNDDFHGDQTNPDKILSEGEQRAVALADFFTEMALDEDSTGFILDDPVTSLDFRWKEVIAKNIIKGVSNKQAIIFTHDLHFLHCLKKLSDEQSVNIRSHWIQKRDDMPGYVFNDNSPMTEKDFRSAKIANEMLDKSLKQGISAIEQQLFLEAGFGALRTSYEALIMFELFNGVVLRFDERISGDRLKKIYIDEKIRDDVAESTGRISRYIGAHLHSDAYASQKPTPKTLREEITHFEEIRKSHKQIKKDHGITD